MRTTATTTAIAELFRRDRQTINRACRDLAPASTKGRVKEYQISEVVDALIASAVAGIAGVGPDDQNAKAFARERTARMRQQRIALERENAVAAGKLVEVEEAGLEVERLFSVVRERLLGIPGAIANDLVIKAKGVAGVDAATIVLRQKLEDALYEALDEISCPEQVVAKISTATFPVLATERHALEGSA